MSKLLSVEVRAFPSDPDYGNTNIIVLPSDPERHTLLTIWKDFLTGREGRDEDVAQLEAAIRQTPTDPEDD